MKRFFSGVFGAVIFFIFSCSAVPRNWYDTVIIKNVSVSPGSFIVDVSGVPPFNFEIYDNPLFEGSPKGNVTVPGKGTFDLPVINPFTITDGEPLYLRGKSRYGAWKVYGPDTEHPTMLMSHSGTLGTQNNPYLVSNKEDLIALSQKDGQFGGASAWSATNYYVLTNDIDMTGITCIPIGIGTDLFYGDFNGDGYVISGLSCYEDTVDGYVGLFGDSAGVIRNLGLKLDDLTITYGRYAGGIVGGLEGSGVVKNCYVVGKSITGIWRNGVNGGGVECLGGIVGHDKSTATYSVINCYTDITITGGARLGVGGVVGTIRSDAAISNCYAVGDIIYNGDNTNGFAGGVLGRSLEDSPNPPTCAINYCAALNNKVVIESGFTLQDINPFGTYDASPSSSLSSFYYKRDMVCPDAGTLTSIFEKINSFTISKNTMPFSSWDFEEVWKWDNSINRPVLRKVRR